MCYWEDKADLIIDKEIEKKRFNTRVKTNENKQALKEGRNNDNNQFIRKWRVQF